MDRGASGASTTLNNLGTTANKTEGCGFQLVAAKASMGTHPLTDGAQDSTENLAKSSRPHEGLLFCFNSRMRDSCLYFQWVWQGQVHPGRLQSLCRSLSLEGLAQNEEVNGGQVPRGYPRQEVPVGPGVVSGMCLTTDIPVRAYQPRNRPVCSRMLTFLAAIGSGTQWACVPQTSVF